MNALISALLLSSLTLMPAFAARCFHDTVQSSPGQLIFLNSGQNFKIFPGGSRLTSSWLPLDKLLVCQIGGAAVQITNESRHGQTVKALRNYGTGQ